MTQEIKERISKIQNGEIPTGYQKTKIGIVPTEWDECRLNTFFDRHTQKNNEGNTNVLTISAQYGLINQNDFFDKEVASEDKSTYILLKQGDFAYNKSYSSGYPFGAIKRLKLYDKGVVSPLYICFTPNSKNKCPLYFEHYFEAGMLNREIHAVAQEGARNHGLLNIAVSDFFNTNMVVPSLPEQEQIAKILSIQDKVIELKEKKLEEKKKQKKYLMQTLLTGKTRLKGFSGEWEKVELGMIFDYIQPTPYIVGSTNYEKSADIPVLTAGKTFVLGYTNETYGVFSNIPVVIFDDFTTASKFVDFPFKVKSSAIKILRCKDQYNIIFAFAALQNIKYPVGGHERHWISKFSNIPIKCPEFAEQTAIANILSTADKELELLEQELEQEKQKKKALMQYLLTGIVRVKV